MSKLESTIQVFREQPLFITGGSASKNLHRPLPKIMTTLLNNWRKGLTLALQTLHH